MRCCHCGIRFFTHPRNAGRRNLRCPFGCRQHHRRQRANARSRKYYRTGSGKKKKKHLNGKRSRFSSNASRNVPTPPILLGGPSPKESPDAPSVNSSNAHSVSRPASQPAPEFAAPSENIGLPLESLVFNERILVSSRILPYVRMVASIIEGRTISRDELMDALRTRMRQHRIGQLPRREYVLCYLNQHPP